MVSSSDCGEAFVVLVLSYGVWCWGWPTRTTGGERNRVQLAKSLRHGANVILLDEPTNDLDVDTLRSLEEVRTPSAHPIAS